MYGYLNRFWGSFVNKPDFLPIHNIALKLIVDNIALLDQGREVFAARNDARDSHQRDFNVEADRWGP